jgi:hypothetical protein
LEAFAKPEVGHLDVVVVQEDVARFKVSVKDVFFL